MFSRSPPILKKLANDKIQHERYAVKRLTAYVNFSKWDLNPSVPDSLTTESLRSSSPSDFHMASIRVKRKRGSNDQSLNLFWICHDRAITVFISVP